jgi:drug/metabolite transporter (DMT)-like permease
MSLASAPLPPLDRTPLGAALMLGFCATGPLIDMFSKLAAASVPVGQITAGRYVFQALLLLPVVLALGLDLRMSRRAVLLTFLRAALSIAATFCFVAAVRVMPIADALAIAFVEPFLLLLIGHFVLHERVGGRRLAAALVGFMGTLMVVRPSFAVFGPVALLPLGTAVFFALYMLSTRSGSKGTHPVVLQAATALAGTAISVPLLAAFQGSGVSDLDPVWPSARGLLWMFGMGASAAGAHMLLTYALRFASATVLAPLHYLELVTATVIGLLVFGDFPDATTWAGIAVIAAAGLYIVHRERVTARAALPLPFDPTS